MRKRNRPPLVPPEMMLSPMIDMMFLLLVFFIVSTMNMSEIKTVPVKLPVAKTSESVSNSTFSVTLKKDGTIYLEDEQIDMEVLIANAAMENKRDTNFSVILRADGDIEYKKVIEMMDKLKGAGIKRFGLATDLGVSK